MSKKKKAIRQRNFVDTHKYLKPRYIPNFCWNSDYYTKENWSRLIAYSCWILTVIFFGFFLLGYIITKINNPSAPDSFGYGDWYFYFGLLTPAALFIGFIYKIKQILARKTRQKDIKKITDKHL